MSSRSCFVLSLVVLVAVFANGQTSYDLAAKYPTVAAFEVRPGILMTAKYAADGQVCEMTLEKQHRKAAEEIDLSSTIPSKLIDELTDELVPEAERGPATSRWLDMDSSVAGGVSDTKRSFENVSIETVGSTSQSCNGGDEVVIVRWKQRTCAAPDQQAGSTKGNNHTRAVASIRPPLK